MATPLSTILTWFETGDFPSEDQFREAWSSFFHKDEEIPQDKIEGLATAFMSFASKSAFNNHLSDSEAHEGQLAKLDASNLSAEQVTAWLAKLGMKNFGVVDDDEATTAVYTKEQVDVMINALTNYYTGVVAEVELINEILNSNDVSLNELQEIVDYIKENREQLDDIHEIVIGNTKDDKVELVGSFPLWGGISLQNQLNEVIYNNITTLAEKFYAKHEATIRVNSTLTHNLGTMDVNVVARDTVTNYLMPIRLKVVDNDNVEVEFDSLPDNDIKITIKRI